MDLLWVYFENWWMVMGLFWVVVGGGRFIWVVVGSGMTILGDSGWWWIILRVLSGSGSILVGGWWWWFVMNLF